MTIARIGLVAAAFASFGAVQLAPATALGLVLPLAAMVAVGCIAWPEGRARRATPRGIALASDAHPYRAPNDGPFGFTTVGGVHAARATRMALLPGLRAAHALAVVAIVTAIGICIRGADLGASMRSLGAGLAASGLVSAIALAYRRVWRLRAAPPRRGVVDDDGVTLFADGADATRWGWDHVVRARDTRHGLVLVLDDDEILVLRSDAGTGRLGQVVRARARGRSRGTATPLSCVVLAHISFAIVAMALVPTGPRPPEPDARREAFGRVAEALAREGVPNEDDVKAAGDGELCAQAQLGSLLASHGRFGMLPPRTDAEDAALQIAMRRGTCAPTALARVGRVVADDVELGRCDYFVFAVDGGRGSQPSFSVVGPYAQTRSTRAPELPEVASQDGYWSAERAVDATIALQERVFRRELRDRPRFEPREPR
jgi:hypothetical protein